MGINRVFSVVPLRGGGATADLMNGDPGTFQPSFFRPGSGAKRIRQRLPLTRRRGERSLRKSSTRRFMIAHYAPWMTVVCRWPESLF